MSGEIDSRMLTTSEWRFLHGRWRGNCVGYDEYGRSIYNGGYPSSQINAIAINFIRYERSDYKVLRVLKEVAGKKKSWGLSIGLSGLLAAVVITGLVLGCHFVFKYAHANGAAFRANLAEYNGGYATGGSILAFFGSLGALASLGLFSYYLERYSFDKDKKQKQEILAHLKIFLNNPAVAADFKAIIEKDRDAFQQQEKVIRAAQQSYQAELSEYAQEECVPRGHAPVNVASQESAEAYAQKVKKYDEIFAALEGTKAAIAAHLDALKAENGIPGLRY